MLRTEKNEGMALRAAPSTIAPLSERPAVICNHIYSVAIRPVPNPDYGQTEAPLVGVAIGADTLRDLSVAFASWRDRNRALYGGGNHGETLIWSNGRPFGRLAYNARVFDLANRAILFDPNAEG